MTVAVRVERGDAVAPLRAARIPRAAAARVDDPAALAIAKVQDIRTIVDDEDVRVAVAVCVERGDAIAASRVGRISGPAAARVDGPAAFAIAKVQVIRLAIVDNEDVRVTVAVRVERGDAVAVSRAARIAGSAAARVLGPAALAIAKVQVIRLKYVDDEDVRVTVAVRVERGDAVATLSVACLLYTSPSPRDGLLSRMPSSA